MVEQNLETVEIQGVDGGALKLLVDYCYTGGTKKKYCKVELKIFEFQEN